MRFFPLWGINFADQEPDLRGYTFCDEIHNVLNVLYVCTIPTNYTSRYILYINMYICRCRDNLAVFSFFLSFYVVNVAGHPGRRRGGGVGRF